MDDNDHLKFLEIVDESAEVYSFEIYAYALMDNHYHLLLKTSALNLSLLMRQINSRYSSYFNKNINVLVLCGKDALNLGMFMMKVI